MNLMIILLAAMFFPAQVIASDTDSEMLSVSPRWANVRSGPGLEYEVLWEAVRYYPVEVVDSDGNWLKISDYENDEGWISRSLLSGRPAVVVVSEKANVREGPGTGYDTLWVVDKEYSFKVLEAQGNWLKVSDGVKVSGWIHTSVIWGFIDQPVVEKSPVY